MHWVPLLRQLDLKYPLAEGNGIEDYKAAWRQLVSVLRDALEAKLGGLEVRRLGSEKSALAYAMSRQAFSTGRVLEASRWLSQALINGRGKLPPGVDWSIVSKLVRQILARVAIAVSRLSCALFGSKHRTGR